MQDEYLNVEVLEWNKRKNMKICIITIINEEITEIIKRFNMEPKAGSYIYWEGHVQSQPNIIIHCYQQNESGNAHSISLTQHVLEKDYDYYFCVGTSGAVSAQLYDVIIATQVVYLEKGANSSEGTQYDGKAPEVTEKEKNLINSFLAKNALENEFDFSIEAAPIYSGERVEKNPKADNLLLAGEFARHLAAIDMESFGVLQALSFCKSFRETGDKFVTIIRGVSDKADELKNATYDDGLSADERKKKAMYNVAKVLEKFVEFIYALGV